MELHELIQYKKGLKRILEGMHTEHYEEYDIADEVIKSLNRIEPHEKNQIEMELARVTAEIWAETQKPDLDDLSHIA